MKKISNILFKQDMEFKGASFKSGYAYKLNFEQFEIDRLLRRGCIYASKDAKYYEEPKKVKPVIKEQKEKINVVDKDIKQAKVQARHSKSSKHKE